MIFPAKVLYPEKDNEQDSIVKPPAVFRDDEAGYRCPLLTVQADNIGQRNHPTRLPGSAAKLALSCTEYEALLFEFGQAPRNRAFIHLCPATEFGECGPDTAPCSVVRAIVQNQDQQAG